MEAEVSDYVVCPNCGKRHSTLVRHRCFKAKGQDEKPDLDPSGDGAEGNDEGKPADSESEGKDSQNSKGKQSNKDAKGKGKGRPDKGDGDKGDQGDGDNDQDQGDGEDGSEGSQGEDQQQGDGEQDGESEDGEGGSPQPKMPEPDIPPVAIVCSVLKFAALCAQCAKNGVMCVELVEDGLFVYGSNGPVTGHSTIPWREIEARATTDGQFFVKEIIDKLDERLGADVPKVDVAAMIERYKPEEVEEIEEALGNNPALTLPLTTGQKVWLDNGSMAVVGEIGSHSELGPICRLLHPKSQTSYGNYIANTGKWCRGDYSDVHAYDAVRDAKLTLPLVMGTRVMALNGKVGTVADKYSTGSEVQGIYVNYEGAGLYWHRISDGKYGRALSDDDADWDNPNDYDLWADVAGQDRLNWPSRGSSDGILGRVKFTNGVPAAVYSVAGDTYLVGIVSGGGGWAQHRLKKLCDKLDNGSGYQIEVDAFGRAKRDPKVQIVENY